MKKIIRIEKELEGIVLGKNTIDEFLGLIRHIYQLPILYDLTKAKNQFLKDGFFKVKIREDILTAKKPKKIAFYELKRWWHYLCR